MLDFSAVIFGRFKVAITGWLDVDVFVVVTERFGGLLSGVLALSLKTYPSLDRLGHALAGLITNTGHLNRSALQADVQDEMHCVFPIQGSGSSHEGTGRACCIF